jgi:alpha-glucosidase
MPAGQAATITSSPDGRVRLRVVDGERLWFDLTFRGQSVVEPSSIGIAADGSKLGEGVSISKTERYQIDETYPWYGVHSMAINRANGARLTLRNKATNTTCTLEVRVFNDGAAFRFLVPGPEGKSRVPDEATLFRIPAGSTVWYHDQDGHYEALYVKKKIEEVPSGDFAMPPVTYQLPGGAGYASITEASLWRYSGMALQAAGDRGFAARLGHNVPASYPYRLRYADLVQPMRRPAAITGDITTPWRVVLVGADLNTLVNCDIVWNLSPEPDKKLFPKGIAAEWIKPGRAVWKYLDGGENTLEEMRNFSRLAAQLGFEYNVIEGHWRRWSFDEIKQFVEDSRKLGVGIVLWKHSRDLKDPAARREFFEMCSKAGVAGAKIDFFDHEHKDVVELYEASLRDAAEFRQVVNFHGANKPTGEARRFPNELTREAIRGMESRRSNRARHDATWPFTRMLAGHADYTPTVFTERRNDTTWAHQIATAAVVTSPMLVYGGHPRSFLENPAVEVIKSIPSVWDQTVVLPISEIGELAAFARRRGDLWILAIVNGETAKSIDVPLSFLAAGDHQAILVRDDPANPAAVQVEKTAVFRAKPIKVDLREGGGFVAKISN